MFFTLKFGAQLIKIDSLAHAKLNRCARLDITEVTLITASSKKTEPHPSPWGGWVPDLVDTQLINNFSSR